ncbi:MAG: methyltransferase domain-containing protein [Myxococcales bacterium]|nr:methyltransferase domain-containing protein [Myxococcales bacterium]
MQRVVEPELMDEAEQALAYAQADFSEPNSAFADLVAETLSHPALRVVDLGCGPADIPVRLALKFAGWKIDAVDGAEAMLAHGRRLVDRHGLGSRVSLTRALLPDLPLASHAYDLVISNSLLHHLHQPRVMWQSVRKLGRPGARVIVMDLLRPASLTDAQRLVALYAGDAPEVLRRDFEASLRAAFTLDEVREQLARAGLADFEVRASSDRHLVVSGQLPH